MRPITRVTVAQLAEFDEIIDVRSPAEFAADHIPGAVNRPVLTDEERVKVGTLYKQESDFAAKKVGAALISRNIAAHLLSAFADKPKNWRPLVYCWRGGSRSGAMVHVLNQVGWRATRFDGGYKSYRHAVCAELALLPTQFSFVVVCGLTGSGKSHLLEAMHSLGAQVLDLEQLAAHRGSVLGHIPDVAQPTQKMFDSRIWWRLRQFDPARPVFIEAESKKVGNLRVPEALIAAMWQAERCVRVEIGNTLRVALLKQEYAHFLLDPDLLDAKLDCLTSLYGHAQIARWKALARINQWDELVLTLLEKHYDPAYGKSMLQHYPHYDQLPATRITSITRDDMLAAARDLLTQYDSLRGPALVG